MQQLSVKIEDGGATNNGKLFSDNWNDLAKEVEEAISASGQNLAPNDLEQLAKSVARSAQGWAFWGQCTGTSTAYIVSPLFNSFTSLSAFEGMSIRFRPHTNNTSITPTVNVFGIGVLNIVNEQGGAIEVGDLSTTRDAEIRWDGSDWLLLDRSKQPLTLSLFETGHIYGFNITDVGNGSDLLIGPGEASGFAGGFNLVLSSTFTKNIKNNWTAGNGGGKPGSVTLVGSTWYPIFVIGGASATPDIGVDSSINPGNLLAYASSISGDTYNRFRQIGWVRMDSSVNIIPFHRSESDSSVFYWKTPIVVATGDSPPDDIAQTSDNFAPPRSEVTLNIFTGYNSSDNQRTFYTYISDTSMIDHQPSDTIWTLRDMDNTASHQMSTQIQLPSSNSNVRWRIREGLVNSNAGLRYRILCIGYRFNRSTM